MKNIKIDVEGTFGDLRFLEKSFEGKKGSEKTTYTLASELQGKAILFTVSGAPKEFGYLAKVKLTNCIMNLSMENTEELAGIKLILEADNIILAKEEFIRDKEIIELAS